MKINLSILLICFTSLLICCSKKEAVITEDPIHNDNGQDQNTTASPCEFDLSSIQAGDTIIIDCLLDLDGKNIDLPDGVIFTFKEGDIINGTLNFSGENNKIDGKLLNSTLTITGNVRLSEETFTFSPSRWKNIIQGTVSYEVALQNTQAFEEILFFIADLGGKTIEIDNFDAYFEVSTVTSTTSDQNFRPTKEAINLPSNIHLKMTNNTFLRMFTTPPGGVNATLMAVRNVDNVKISGGNLIGDRLTRKYVGDGAGEQGSRLFSIHASRSIEVDNVTFEYGSGGGITIFSLGFPFNPDYIPTDGVLIKNSIFKNLRRMSTSVTDGKNIKIIGNTYINTGQPIANNDDGGNVGYAINIETFRKRDDDGNLLEYQRVNNVEVKDNIEDNSRIGFLLVLGSSDVIAENNTVQTRMAFNFSSGVTFSNNNFIGKTNQDQSFAIFGAGENSEFTFDNEIHNNTIDGNYGTGISLSTQKCKLYQNTIKNVAVGIQISSSNSIDIYENKIKASNNGVFSNSTTINAIQIFNNTIESDSFHMKFTLVNQTPESSNFAINIYENEFINQASSVSISNTKGINFNKNTLLGGISLNNVVNTNITSNTIAPKNSNGILLQGDLTELIVEGNTISKPTVTRFECISNESTSTSEVTTTNNSCN
ncbi:NosD domain-containing protein [Tenacibaculum agarivorans]|uniref:NosD domain-containing protein n=1 Tax=Tenacibaculum agarivorans TaxID=1908389 RepID=UPI0009F9247E|nr:NosD domain-containing protein [Tenacibaculum agarivorans]